MGNTDYRKIHRTDITWVGIAQESQTLLDKAIKEHEKCVKDATEWIYRNIIECFKAKRYYIRKLTVVTPHPEEHAVNAQIIIVGSRTRKEREETPTFDHTVRIEDIDITPKARKAIKKYIKETQRWTSKSF